MKNSKKKHPQLGYRKLHINNFGPGENRLGAVIVFKKNVTEEQARLAFKQIENVLETTPQLNKFDKSKSGNPVFYLPYAH